jgi:hypothetical protein
MFASFSHERMLTTARNLLSDVAELVRDGEAMMDVAVVDATEPAASPMRPLSVLRQRPLLRRVVRVPPPSKAPGPVELRSV